MSTEQNILQPAPDLRRKHTVFTRTLLHLSLPGAVLSALWITAGRALLGAGGDLVPVFAVSFGPALLVVLLCATFYSYRDARRCRPIATTPMIAGLQITTWILAFIFGLLCPDRIDGRTVSAAAHLLGEDFIGLSAGFGNTFGILTFVAAFALFFVARAEERRSRKLSAGITDEMEEELARQQSTYDFLDE